ncbi:hypothetical protein JW823_00040 [bacterium]|nr:hypothetical protein [candidate division CSSED10-310 bacterium]
MFSIVNRVCTITCMVCFISGCTVTRHALTRWEDRRATLSRGLADIVDATDRAFGEPRVGDEEEIVQVKVDLVPSYYSESEFSMNMPVRVRIPLPCIQRRAKFFFQIDSSADPRDPIADTVSTLEDNKTITSGFLFFPNEKIRTGSKLDVYWKGSSPQAGLRPFFRYEVKKDPVRYYAEQQVYWRTDDRFGAKTTLQFDRIISDLSFLRFACSGEYQEVTYAAQVWNGIAYRSEIGENSAMSLELGSAFNPHHGATTRDTVEELEERDENDNDRVYFRTQFVGKLPIEWLEYGIEPGVDYYWHHERPWDYGVAFTLRIIVFEAFLRGKCPTDS